MTEFDKSPAGQRFYEAVSRWLAEPMLGPARMIDTTCAAQIGRHILMSRPTASIGR
ncbi:hypothetical protein JOF56_009829 [Kibdelosporangium banguiense]|uniref:Uncharacterized protein n=1 Tax=Kibdelosporangium banguiense TaxID=1365924 RepID=A0ABS4TYH6_9PSEU|nr:hypothetical protein [Kibdelosporangium banguiense]MBP2329444.1 hypothetical protein [Kibdelosporangium banguiense]